VVIALSGFLAGAALSPAARTEVGPLVVDVSVRPSLSPGSAVELPPVGSVRFDTHRTPIQVQARIRSVDIEAARRVIAMPALLGPVMDRAPDVVSRAAARALASAVLCGLLGAGLLTGLATRSRGGTAVGLVAVLMTITLLAVGTAATFDSTTLAQPRFAGVLSSAPYVQRRTQTLAARLESYRSGLADFVQSVTTLYAVGDRLPKAGTGMSDDVITVLHISDLHLNPIGFDLTDRLVEQFQVDAVVDSGDLSTWGTSVEQGFVGRVAGVGVPYVFVRGNHDSPLIARAVRRQPNAVVLDGTVATVAGLRIAGVADPRNLPAEGPGDASSKGLVLESVGRLAGVVGEYDAAHPGAPVQLAVVHDPTRLDPLRGRVPLVLSGHLHKRSVEYRDGTRVMVQGSTGGAGLTADGLQRLTDGRPVPLEATLLYFARTGPDAGRLLAYDDVTVGGLGLTSVSIDRTLVPREQVNPQVLPTTAPSSGVRSWSSPPTAHVGLRRLGLLARGRAR
jgi:predicted MPP superfamily phosphohydrolase